MTKRNEEWRLIPGFGRYEASDLGRIRSWCNNRHGRCASPRILKTSIASGYAVCGVVRDDGVKQPISVHVLVLLAFAGPRPFPRAHARHLNDVRLDNRACNLAWGSAQDNAVDAQRNGCSTWAQLTEAQAIAAIQALAVGESAQAIADRLGVARNVIWQIKARRTWKHLPRPAHVKCRPRLAPERVQAIREASGTHGQIARTFGVSVTTVHNIRTGKAHRQK